MQPFFPGTIETRRRLMGVAIWWVITGLPIAASAHDVWLTVLDQPTGTRRAVINHGHPGDRKIPDPDKLFELDVLAGNDRIESLLGHVETGSVGDIAVLISDPLPPVPDGGMWLTAQYDNGYWVKTRHGYRNTSKRQVPDAEESLWSIKYAKAFLDQGPAESDLYRTPVGQRLELIPLTHPSTLRAGESLSLLVQFNGQPLPGASVEYGDGLTPVKEEAIPQYETDQAGIASVIIQKPGPQLLVVDHKTASANPDLAQYELHNATLSFYVHPPQSN